MFGFIATGFRGQPLDLESAEHTGPNGYLLFRGTVLWIENNRGSREIVYTNCGNKIYEYEVQLGPAGMNKGYVVKNKLEQHERYQSRVVLKSTISV